jgi:transcriptional regulator with XRE-family HTH domain
MAIPTPSEYLRERISELRLDHGLSQQEVSNRLVVFGFQLDRSAVAKVEKGTRGVSIDEAIGFAFALDVPLLALLFPAGDNKVRLARRDIHSGLDARAWASGLLSLGAGEEYFVADDDVAPFRIQRAQWMKYFISHFTAAVLDDDVEEMDEWLDAIENEVGRLREEIDRGTRTRKRGSQR